MRSEARSTATSPHRRWARLLWIGSFTPICTGFLVGGFLNHWVFLLALPLWLTALACVLRVETLDHQTRLAGNATPRQSLAKAGWAFLALILIFASGGLMAAVLR